MKDEYGIRKFGELIRHLRYEQNLTLVDVERQTGLSKSFLSGLENGKNRIHRVGQILALYKVLNPPDMHFKEWLVLAVMSNLTED